MSKRKNAYIPEVLRFQNCILRSCHLFVIFAMIFMEMTKNNFNFLRALLVNSNAETIYSRNDRKIMKNDSRLKSAILVYVIFSALGHTVLAKIIRTFTI